MIEQYTVVVTLTVEAESHAAATIVVEDAVKEKNQRKIEARSPNRLYVEDVSVKKGKRTK